MHHTHHACMRRGDPPWSIGGYVQLTRPGGLHGAAGKVLGSSNGYLRVGLDEGGEVNVRAREVEPLSTDGEAGDWEPHVASRPARSIAARVGVAVGSEVVVTKSGEHAGRRGYVVRMANGYIAVAVMEAGKALPSEELHLRAREVRPEASSFVGCWCGTDRHLPTNAPPSRDRAAGRAASTGGLCE